MPNMIDAVCQGCEHYRDCDIDEISCSAIAQLTKAQAEAEKLHEVLTEIANYGTSMPPGFGDEVAWYRGVCWGLIRMAANSIQITGEKFEPRK